MYPWRSCWWEVCLVKKRKRKKCLIRKCHLTKGATGCRRRSSYAKCRAYQKEMNPVPLYELSWKLQVFDFYKSALPWYNCNGWLGVKHQVTTTTTKMQWMITHLRLYADKIAHLRLYADRITHLRLYADRITHLRLYADRIAHLRLYADRIAHLRLYADKIAHLRLYADKIAHLRLYADKMCFTLM